MKQVQNLYFVKIFKKILDILKCFNIFLTIGENETIPTPPQPCQN